MKAKKAAWLLFYIGVVLLLLGVIFGNSLVLKAVEINGIHCFDKVAISAKQSLHTMSYSCFTPEDVKNMGNILHTSEFTFTAQCTAQASNDMRSCNVNVIGTNDKYINFDSLIFTSGCFFNYEENNTNDYMAVIDEKLAWNIFKSEDVTGKRIKLFNRDFEIIGVFARDKSIAGVLYQSEKPCIFIPANTLMQLNQEARITSFQVKADGKNTTESSTQKVLNAIKALGKNPEDYYLTDYSVSSRVLTQKPEILLFICGVLCTIVIFRNLKTKIINIYYFIKKNSKNNYLSQIMRNNAVLIITGFAKILLWAAAIVFVVSQIKFDLYIIPEHIPEELVDFKFFIDLFKKGIDEGISNMGYIPSMTELKFQTLFSALNALTMTSIFIGLPLVYISLYQLKLEGYSINSVNIKIGVAFVFILIAATAICVLCNMPVGLKSGQLSVIFLFVFVNSVHLLKQSEGAE